MGNILYFNHTLMKDIKKRDVLHFVIYQIEKLVGITKKISRKLATKRMVDEATALGADAIVGVRYGSSAVMQGAEEIVAYGTAVKYIN